jgi:hypothetical protein
MILGAGVFLLPYKCNAFCGWIEGILVSDYSPFRLISRGKVRHWFAGEYATKGYDDYLSWMR